MRISCQQAAFGPGAAGLIAANTSEMHTLLHVLSAVRPFSFVQLSCAPPRKRTYCQPRLTSDLSHLHRPRWIGVKFVRNEVDECTGRHAGRSRLREIGVNGEFP